MFHLIIRDHWGLRSLWRITLFMLLFSLNKQSRIWLRINRIRFHVLFFQKWSGYWALEGFARELEGLVKFRNIWTCSTSFIFLRWHFMVVYLRCHNWSCWLSLTSLYLAPSILYINCLTFIKKLFDTLSQGVCWILLGY